MNLPEQFIQRTKPFLQEEWDAFEQSFEIDSPVSVRINPFKSDFITSHIDLEKVLWADLGYYLTERPNFTFDPLFHAGCYYSQEASSMFIEQAIIQYGKKENLRVLDLCAAPGGKSTHLLSLLDDSCLLVSNEVIRSRANILSENVIKWGRSNVIVANNDPVEIGKIKNYFDIILVDAPCSGEGMFRKDNDVVNEWSESNVRLCKQRQQRIVADVWDALKPNGILIYSTCTYYTDENEENVQWIADTFDAEILAVSVPDEWKITGSQKGSYPAYRFFPHRTKGEGFFMAVLRKTDTSDASAPSRKRNNKNTDKKQAVLSEKYKMLLTESHNYIFAENKHKWLAIPSSFYGDYESLKSSLRIISAGIELGEIKGKDFIPSHALAMSTEANLSLFPTLDIDWDKAITFLRRETFEIPALTAKGHILLTHRNIPLGFMKNIGNRANNLYPHDWRIRTTYLPERFVPFI